MKNIFIFTLILMALTACTALQAQAPEPAATDDMPPVNMPNPASLYCEQNGNTLEIRTADDGGQNGICVFPDGSSCDEWAYFRGECSPAAQESSAPDINVEATLANASGGFMPPDTTEEIADWWGVIKSTEPGAQYDDYFERQDLGQIIYFGIDSLDPAVKAQIEALRDSGKIVHLYGILHSNVPDYNGSQIQVVRIAVEE
jgi:putative hemolysin